MNFNRAYTEKEINKIINSMVILIDTRDKQISHIIMYLKHNNINYERYTLEFADYSFKIPKNIDLGIEEDLYFYNEIAIERKASAEEISNNFSNCRDRFKREFEKGNNKIRVMIENTTYSDISNHNYDTKFSEKSFIGSLHSFQESYNAPFIFIDKNHSGEYIYNTFKYYLRNKLRNNKINA